MPPTQTSLQWRPRRSCLFVPASNERALEKAAGLPADAIIIDLEDAVAPEAKDAARDNAAIRVVAMPGRDVFVRINTLGGEWGVPDIMTIAPLGLSGIVLPKVESGAEIVDADDALTGAGLPEDSALWAMIETPMGVLNLPDIAAAARATRLSGLVLGLNDLAKATGMRAKSSDGSADRTPFFTAMAQLVTAARAYGLCAIDAVFNDFRDDEAFARECRQGRDFGFDGKSLIHPAQIAFANLAFAPAPEEVAKARAIIAAFAAPENAGKGVIAIDGIMAERLHLAEAERLVAIADAIAERG